METQFMRAFERRDAAEAQMRQQAASYSRTLARALLAAVPNQPPPWLLPHPAPFAALLRRGEAAEEMRLQVEAFSQSVACALIDAGHMPPPWLLLHSAAAGTSERSVPADARMRKQVVSYSLSIACALLAAGHRPPPWPLQSPADVATEGNTVRKGSDYLDDPKSANHVQHEQSEEVNHQVNQNTLEAPRFQSFEVSNSMASPRHENGSLHSTKSTFLERLDCVSCSLPENGEIDIVDNVSIEVYQGRPQTDVPEETCSMPIVLLDKKAGHSSETTSLEGSFCLVSPKIEKDLLHTRKRSSLLDRCDKVSPRTLEQQNSGCHVLSSSINESAVQLYHLADTTEAHDVCVWNNIDIAARPEALSAASSKRASVSNTLERNSTMLSGKNADHVQHVLSEINYHVKKNIVEPDSSLEVPRSETFEGPSSIAYPLLASTSDSRILEQQRLINESALQLYHLADSSEARDVCVSNNIAAEALSAAASKRARVSHTLERNSVMSSDKSVPMLECHSFSISVPSDSPTITERALQGFSESKKFVNFCSSLSVKYKMKPLNSVYQSLPSRFENLMNQSLAYSIDTKLLDPSYASKKLEVFGKYSLDFDDAFMKSNGQTFGSSNVYSVQEDSEVPLLLSFEKYDLEKLPATTGSRSDYLGSIPGFGCSKIDEDSTILGVNENQAKLSHSIGRNFSRQCLGGRKLLGYAANIYQSKGTISRDLTSGKSYIRKPDQHLHIRDNRDIKNPKEVRALSIMNAEKITHSLRDRLSKTEMPCSKSERNRRETNLEKGCRPWNTVSNFTSFIPHAKQNQQPPKSCAKRNVRVRALKVAAAAKRHEEKKQTEREMHKAAVKLALERLKQEKEHRQKQVEHKKKMEADFITRNRQREGDGKRENDRKRKCAEEAQLEEIMHSTNTVKDACPKDTDGNDLVENLVERVGNQLLSDERMESVQRLLATESNSVKAMYAHKSAGSGLQVQENLSDNVDKSYGMTPYEDSDAKDFEILEHKRKVRRRRKLIPSWAQKENLDKILASNLALDPREVFAHKCHPILSDVLTPWHPSSAIQLAGH